MPRAMKHGHTAGGQTTAEYRIWNGMLRRTTKPSEPAFPLYGGRGIGVCDRWLSFENFLADMGPRPSAKHSLDRIDNDAGYSPENCRWATQREQCANMRKNRWLTFDGRTQIIADWARETGLPSGTISNRLALGWSVERALTTPARPPAKPKVLQGRFRSTCRAGHPLDDENTAYTTRGDGRISRRCKTCKREAERRGYHRRRYGAATP